MESTFVMLNYTCKLLTEAQTTNNRCRILFVAFDEQERDHVNKQLRGLLPADRFQENSEQFVQVETQQSLYKYIANIAGIQTSHLIRPEFQRELLLAAYESVKNVSYKTYKNLISANLQHFFDKTCEDQLFSCLCWECSRIKLFAQESLDKYRLLKKSTAGVPLTNEDDVDYVFKIFAEYSSQLQSFQLCDPDDTVIGINKYLSNPQRKSQFQQKQFDYIFVDEDVTICFADEKILNLLKKEGTNK